jgi:predicted phosphodiesterase
VKIRILSDLHLEFADISLPKVEADVVILAGDIDVEGNGLEWALNTFSDLPVLYVLGNHEYYSLAKEPIRRNQNQESCHHAPSEKSVPPQCKGDILSAAFASNFEPLVESSNTELWVHGHMHTAMDYHIGKPRGYPGERGTNFFPNLIVEL